MRYGRRGGGGWGGVHGYVRVGQVEGEKREEEEGKREGRIIIQLS